MNATRFGQRGTTTCRLPVSRFAHRRIGVRIQRNSLPLARRGLGRGKTYRMAGRHGAVAAAAGPNLCRLPAVRRGCPVWAIGRSRPNSRLWWRSCAHPPMTRTRLSRIRPGLGRGRPHHRSPKPVRPSRILWVDPRDASQPARHGRADRTQLGRDRRANHL